MRDAGGGDGGRYGEGGEEIREKLINTEDGIQHADDRCFWRRKPTQEN